MEVRDRVTLVADSTWAGVVTDIHNGIADVDFDGGGKGRMNTDSLTPEQPEPYDRESDVREEAKRERERAKADKSWPPKSMETKVPKVDGTK